MADLHTYDGKGDKSFTDWITNSGRKIAHLTLYPELWSALAKAEGIVYKLIENMPLSSVWEIVKERL